MDGVVVLLKCGLEISVQQETVLDKHDVFVVNKHTVPSLVPMTRSCQGSYFSHTPLFSPCTVIAPYCLTSKRTSLTLPRALLASDTSMTPLRTDPLHCKINLCCVLVFFLCFGIHFLTLDLSLTLEVFAICESSSCTCSAFQKGPRFFVICRKIYSCHFFPMLCFFHTLSPPMPFSRRLPGYYYYFFLILYLNRSTSYLFKLHNA